MTTKSKKVVIVESPAKAKTIEKYLGKDYKVFASYGHVRDLIPKKGAVDTEHDFEMHYQKIVRNAKHLKAIVAAVKDASVLLLATDPDREGEAIAWHVCEELRRSRVLAKKEIHRIVFHEITKTAIQEAVSAPREIAMDLVNAQQARRALDYLVGFNLSPLLWKKIKPGLSAGRVQSPALRLIVEREQEIADFRPQEYWTVEAATKFKNSDITAKLTTYHGEKLEQFSVTNTEQAKAIEDELTKLAQGKLIVIDVERKQRKRNPAPPFITASLQQEAARKLGFTAKRTMVIAQQLYEGIDIGNETIGLITYMRTDSVILAQEALTEIRELIAKRYGVENLPEKPCYYKTKSKSAQEAHEAIRPTSVFRLPDDLKKHLSLDQFKLYSLIWQRTVACQMIPALIDLVAIDFACGKNNVFRANGSSIATPGFIMVYQEGRDDAKEDDAEKLLPNLQKGDEVQLLQITGLQHFTEPPPRYSEASLIKTLEEYGIGRPSTYAAIIATIQDREYVTLENKQFRPTEIGKLVTKFLTEYFTKYVDYDFTANLENELDEIARGEKVWLRILEEFWAPFNQLIKQITDTVKRKDIMQKPLDENCPQCGKPLVMRFGKRGNFIGCSGYPECNYTRNVEGAEQQPVETIDRDCPQCGAKLQIKFGRYGKFLGCSNYPNCKFIESLSKPTDTGVQCPQCQKGTLLKRRSKKGRFFYGCSGYPDCKYVVWNEPVNEKCPKCDWPIMTIKITKSRGTEKICPKCSNVAEGDK